MKGKNDKEFIKLKNKFILGVLIALIFGGSLIFLFVKKISLIGPINTMIKQEKTFVLFIDNYKCSNCQAIKKFLDEKNVKYEELDEDSEEAKVIFKKNNIVTEESISPAIIYITKGKMTAYLVNMKTTDELNLFIDNYKLNK